MGSSGTLRLGRGVPTFTSEATQGGSAMFWHCPRHRICSGVQLAAK